MTADNWWVIYILLLDITFKELHHKHENWFPKRLKNIGKNWKSIEYSLAKMQKFDEMLGLVTYATTYACVQPLHYKCDLFSKMCIVHTSDFTHSIYHNFIASHRSNFNTWNIQE